MVLGDVHGNAVAFAAVLEEILPTRRISWSSTATSHGAPSPRRRSRWQMSSRTALFVRGNAESALRSFASRDSETEGWMLERHTAHRIAEIERFAGAVSVIVEGVGRILVCHGSRAATRSW